MDLPSDALASVANGVIRSAPRLSLAERLKQLKDAAPATQTTTLPVSRLKVSYPGFVNHDKVMAATKLAGKNRSKVGIILVAQVVTFEGERMTVDEIGALLHNRDTVHLINLVLGEEDGADDEDGAGN